MKPARRRARARGPALRPIPILQAADHACYLCGGRFDALTLDHSSRSPEAARTQDGTCCRHVSPATPARTTGCCRNWTSCPPGLPTTRGCGSCSRPASSGHPTWRMTSARNAWVSSVWTARLLASGMRRPAQDQDMDDEHAGELVRPADGGVQAHEASVQLLSVGVPGDRPLQDCEGGAGVAVALVEV